MSLAIQGYCDVLKMQAYRVSDMLKNLALLLALKSRALYVYDYLYLDLLKNRAFHVYSDLLKNLAFHVYLKNFAEQFMCIMTC